MILIRFQINKWFLNSIIRDLSILRPHNWSINIQISEYTSKIGHNIVTVQISKMNLNFLKEAGLNGLAEEPSVRLFIVEGNRGQSLNPGKEADRKDKVFRAGNFAECFNIFEIKNWPNHSIPNYNKGFNSSKVNPLFLDHLVEHLEYNIVIKKKWLVLMKIHQSLCFTNHSLKSS